MSAVFVAAVFRLIHILTQIWCKFKRTLTDSRPCAALSKTFMTTAEALLQQTIYSPTKLIINTQVTLGYVVQVILYHEVKFQ